MNPTTAPVCPGSGLLLVCLATIDVIPAASPTGSNTFQQLVSLAAAVFFFLIYTILTAIGVAERRTIWRTRIFAPLFAKNLLFASITFVVSLPALDYLIHGGKLAWGETWYDPEVRLLTPVLYMMAAVASLWFAEGILEARDWHRGRVAALYAVVFALAGGIVGALITLGAVGLL